MKFGGRNSGTRQGNAKAFDYYHNHIRKMPNGDGYVEIGPRRSQINGGHVDRD